jgi:signal transduction histidine kinase
MPSVALPHTQLRGAQPTLDSPDECCSVTGRNEGFLGREKPHACGRRDPGERTGVRRRCCSLKRQLILWGVALTWLTGGVVGAIAYLELRWTARREALARVQDAVRVARRMVEADLDSPRTHAHVQVSLPAATAADRAALEPLLVEARARGLARGFVLLGSGLSLAEARFEPGTAVGTVTLRPLRGANELSDLIRDVVFGPGDASAPNRATVTIFERDVRIATNVLTPDGQRAIGTHASPAVARQVLGEGRPWLDRALVLGRWTVACYKPLRSPAGQVVGMLYAGLDEAPYVHEIHETAASFLGIIAGLALLVSGLVWWLGGRLARPLSLLTVAATEVGAGRRSAIAVEASQPAEIRVLGETFNAMEAQIHARTTELESSRQQAQRALDDYLEVLGFVAHELKSPLAGAKMQLQAVDDGYYGEPPAAMHKPLGALRRAIDYGHEVATSFNQLCRAEGVGFQTTPRDIASFAAEVIRPAFADVADAAAARKMTLSLEGDAEHVRGDPDLLRVVMNNLLGNAVKYGREDTPVQVTVHRDIEGVKVKVHNQGIGVAPDKMPNLFQKFYRVHDPETKTTKGTGVGLYLVRRLVELHDGRATVEGEYGKWIAFSFVLPEAPTGT